MAHIDTTTPNEANREFFIRPILNNIKLHTAKTTLPIIIPLSKNRRR